MDMFLRETTEIGITVRLSIPQVIDFERTASEVFYMISKVVNHSL